MPHVGPWALIHEGRVQAIGLRQADLVGYVGVDSLVSSGLGGKRRVVLLHHFLLHSNSPFLVISLLVSDHLQILDLGLWGGGQPFLHSLPGLLPGHAQLLPFALELDDVGLAHGEL